MPRPSVGARTMDGASVARCMSVALTRVQEAACRTAIVPVELVSCMTVEEAVKVMATALPLVVLVDEGMSESDRTSIVDVASAVSAEIFDVEPSPEGRPFQQRILEALIRGERKRFKRAP